MKDQGFDIRKTSAFVSYSRKERAQALIVYPPHAGVLHVHLNELGFDEYLQKFPDKVDLLDLTHFFFGSVNYGNYRKNGIDNGIDWDLLCNTENAKKIADFLLHNVGCRELERSIAIIGDLIPKGYDQYIFVLASSKQTPTALCLAQYLKRRRKKIIIAGSIMTPYPKPVRLKELMVFPFVDIVARSFEQNIIDLISDRSIGKVSDIWYREGGEIKRNKRSSPPIRLKNLPAPRYKHLEKREVRQIYYELSRGCVQQCVYCVHAEQVLDVRPVDMVIRDLKYLIKRFNCRKFRFFCTAVNPSRRYVLDVCDAMIAARINIRWGSYIFYEAIDEEVAGKLRQAGCSYVDGGIESPELGGLNVNKIKSMRTVEMNLALLRKNGIRTYVAFMLGGIGQPVNEDEEIIKFALRNQENIDYIFLNRFEINTFNIKNILKKYKDIKVSARCALDQEYYDFVDNEVFRERSLRVLAMKHNIKTQVEGRTNIKLIYSDEPVPNEFKVNLL